MRYLNFSNKDLNKANILFYGCLSLSFLFVVYVFAPHLVGLMAAWKTEEYSHGYIIPIIAILIGWHRLCARPPEISSSWVGLVFIGVGFLLLIISKLSAFEPPSHYGFIVCLVGLSFTFFGKSFTTILIPSFIYLFFAVPLPQLIYVGMSSQLQLISSNLGVLILQVLGVSVFQEGNVIDLGDHKLQVVEACSGLRYLFPLLSFSFLMAFLLKDKMWKRALIFLSAIPITILMNSLRIAIVGVLVNWGGSEMAQGFVHDLEGWTIFVACIAVLFALTFALIHVGKTKGRIRHEYIGLASGKIFLNTPSLKPQMILTFLLCVVLSMPFLLGSLENRTEIVPKHPPFATFPLTINNWHGVLETLPPDILAELKLNDYWLASYEKKDSAAPVNFYMAYYGSQRMGSSIHSPANCLPGGGWDIVNRAIVPVDVGGQTIGVTKMMIQSGENRLMVYYWFDQRGRIINEQYGAKWYLLVDSITKQRTDGALVRLTTPILKGEKEDVSEKRILDFLKDVYPNVKSFVPR